MLRHHFRLGNVITTVDAVNGLGRPESLKQVAVADRLVLTKTDLAAAEPIEALLDEIRRLNPSAPLWRAAEEPVDAEALLRQDLFALAERSEWFAGEIAEHHGHGHDRNRHGDSIHAFALTFEGELDWTMFGVWLTMLLNRHGETVLRVKGILNVAGSPTPVAVHGVQHLVHPPVHMAAWPDGDRRSRLVFIVDGLERSGDRTVARRLPAPGSAGPHDGGGLNAGVFSVRRCAKAYSVRLESAGRNMLLKSRCLGQRVRSDGTTDGSI